MAINIHQFYGKLTFIFLLYPHINFVLVLRYSDFVFNPKHTIRFKPVAFLISNTNTQT